jgi:3-methyladenine DNA glycosylase Tag
MEKLIIHFRESEDEKGIYNLFVKVIDIPSEEESDKLTKELKQKGFDILGATTETIIAKFTNIYSMVLDVERELDKEGWVFKEMGKMIIDIPGYRKTLQE